MTVETISTPAPTGPDLSNVNIEAAPSMSAPLVTPEVVTPPVATPAETTPAASPESVTPAQTLLADGLDKNTETAVETPSEAPAPMNEGGQSDETAPPPESTTPEATEVAEATPEAPREVVFEPWTLPEGVSLDQTKVLEFTELLKGLELEGKADHSVLQAFGQKAIDFHLNEVNRVVEDLTKSYQIAWSKQVNDWKEEFLADPVIGGNRFQTTVDAALSFIRTHGGSPEEQQEFRNLMESTGLGNNKTVIRILANAGRAMSEGKPLAATIPAPAPKSKVETLYGNKGRSIG